MVEKLERAKIINAFKRGKLSGHIKSNAYETFAKYYDIIMNDIDYKSWVEYILDICIYYDYNPTTILDVACGTGNVTIPLKKLGYNICGLDSSYNMLRVAKHKCLKFNLDIKFYLMDMIKFQIGDTFDLILSLNDSYNYIIDKAQLKEAYITVYNHLKKGGFFIFDLSTEYNILKNFHNKVEFKSFKGFAYKWENYYNKDTKEVRTFLEFYEFATNTLYREEHIQKIHSKEDIVEILYEVGFSKVNIYKGLTFKQPTEKDCMYHYVCQK